MLFTSQGDRYLGDSLYDPFFEELERRKAIVFIHPNTISARSQRAKARHPLWRGGIHLRHHTLRHEPALQRDAGAISVDPLHPLPCRRHSTVSRVANRWCGLPARVEEPRTDGPDGSAATAVLRHRTVDVGVRVRRTEGVRANQPDPVRQRLPVRWTGIIRPRPPASRTAKCSTTRRARRSTAATRCSCFPSWPAHRQSLRKPEAKDPGRYPVLARSG